MRIEDDMATAPLAHMRNDIGSFGILCHDFDCDPAAIEKILYDPCHLNRSPGRACARCGYQARTKLDQQLAFGFDLTIDVSEKL
jgi:hypothetical protein